MIYHYQRGLFVPFFQKYYKFIALAVAGLFVLFQTALLLQPAQAASSTVIVQPNDIATSATEVIADPSSWLFYNDENDTIDYNLGSFVSGPSIAPAGDGSIEISVSGTQRRNLATYQFSGTLLSDITELKYSTFNGSAGNGGSSSRSGYLGFNVDFDNSDTWQRRINFLPWDNGTVQSDTWQEWDAINSGNALWTYSGSTWPVTGESGSTPKTWSQILADYPGVRVRVTDSWMGIRVGEPYTNGYTENLDKFIFGTASGTTIFDFEPFTPPAPAAQTEEIKYQSEFALTPGAWAYFDDISNTPTATANSTHSVFINPVIASGDNGAVKLDIISGEKWNLVTTRYTGIPLSGIASLGFSTHTSAPGSAYLNLDVDFDNTVTASSYQGRLIYVPSLTPNTWIGAEAVASNSLWSWSQYDENGNMWPDGETSAQRPWNEIVEAFPNAEIMLEGLGVGGLYLRADGDGGASTTYFDHVYLATNTENIKFNFELPDTTAPAVTGLVLNGENVTSPRSVNCGPTDFNLVSDLIDLSATITDDSGVASAKYKIRKVTPGGCTQAAVYNSGNVNMNNSSGDTWITLPGTELDTNDVPADGDYTIQMTVKDNLGNTGTQYIDITVDNTKPSAQITSPDNGDVLSNDFTIIGTASDVTSGIDRVEMNITKIASVGCSGCYQGTVVNGALTTYDLNTDSFSYDVTPLNLADGVYRLKIQAFDKAGNWKYHYIDVEVDETSPTVVITDPASGAFVNNVFVDGEVADANLSFFNIQLSKVGDPSWNFTTQKIFAAAGQSLYELNDFDLLGAAYYGVCDGVPCVGWLGGSLPDGEYKIRVNAYDKAGNRTIYSHNFYLDNLAPTMPEHLFPTDGAVLNSANLYVDWTGSSDNFTPQNDIRYEYRLYLVDPDTNPGATIRFSQDYTGTSRHPASGFAPGTPEDTYWWTVRACDQLDNCSNWTNSWQFTVDSTPPTKVEGLAIFDDEGEVTDGNTNDYSVTTKWDSTPDTVKYEYCYWNDIASSPYNEGNCYTSFPTSNQQPGVFNQGEGVHHIKVRGIDAAGNKGPWSDTLTIRYDTTDPVTVNPLTSPSGGDVLSGLVTIAGTTTDTDGSGVDFVNFYYAEAGTVNYSFITSVDNPSDDSPFNWTHDWTPPSEGTYDIKAAGVDVAGNEESSAYALAVVVDNTAPVVDVTSHENGDIVAGTINIEGVVTDDNPSHYWFVLQNAGGNTIAGPEVVYDNNSPANPSFSFDTTSTDDGTYYIKLEARDAAGNKDPNAAPILVDPEVVGDSVDWVTIYVDNTPGDGQEDEEGNVLSCTTNQNAETGNAGVIGNTNGGSAESGDATNVNTCIFTYIVNGDPVDVGTIQGLVYEDENSNGAKDSGELALEGWSVWLLTKNSPYTIRAIDVTDADGMYLFEDLDFGTYYVCQDLPEGWLQTELNDAGSGGVSATTPAIGDELDLDDADVEQFCYTVELSVDQPFALARDFGNFQIDDGHALGAIDDRTNDPKVLGESDALAETGTQIWLGSLVGLIIMALAGLSNKAKLVTVNARIRQFQRSKQD